jgi:uncharacterized protein YabN with tetrapyrrole methylase and pyrophosphatase domain
LTGSLVVVGTGIGAGQLTAESRAAIAAADEVLYLIGDPVAVHAVRDLNGRSRSLEGCYEEGAPRRVAYERMVGEMLAGVRAGRRVCAAFYGHPGVFVLPSHEAVRRARAEGFEARMLPAVSAEDCLFADLGVDPANDGCQSYEASDFLRRRPVVEPTAALVLWQVGVVGERTHSHSGSAPEIAALAALLVELYPEGHEAVVYQAAPWPGVQPLVRRLRLADLDGEAVTPLSTLYVPAVPR